jgi:uncharacterized repeat protein (TIGR01451 family)
MKTRMSKMLLAISFALAAAAATPASAQAGPTLLQEKTSPDGLLTLTLWSANGSDTAGVDNTYTWIATNGSTTVTLTGVILGSHWGDWCGVAQCTPPGPTLIALAPGCSGQGAADVPVDAHFGAWCVPTAGVTLLPGESVGGSVTLRPGAGGPPDYTVYTGYNDPVSGKAIFATPAITNTNVVAPAATDVQIKGAASNGAPPAGSTFTYTYEVKNAGPWGTYGGIIFVDTLPASLTYVSSSATIAGMTANLCSAVGQTVMCSLIDLQNGGTFGQATITLTVTASGVPQPIVNTASVHTVLPQVDSNTLNNSAEVSVTTR